MNQTETCRYHDTKKKDIEMAFFPIYTVMFILSVILNSVLLYVVIKKENFVHEKRAFHKLFQFLVFLDLIISILILPNILIKKFTEDTDTHILLDGFLAIRDFSISAQLITLVLIAIDRLLAFLIPLSNCWVLDTVLWILKSIMILLGSAYIGRLILLSINIGCSTKRKIDKYAKNIIGISGGLFMIINLFIYLILFLLLCQRQIIRQRNSFNSEKFYRAMQSRSYEESPDENENRLANIEVSLTKPKRLSSLNIKRLSFKRKIGSIKFAKVLLSVNLLMIISYLPAVLYNGKVIPFPSYSIYYLFFLHSLGDPILFFITRRELKKGLISICKHK